MCFLRKIKEPEYYRSRSQLPHHYFVIFPIIFIISTSFIFCLNCKVCKELIEWGTGADPALTGQGPLVTILVQISIRYRNYLLWMNHIFITIEITRSALDSHRYPGRGMRKTQSPNRHWCSVVPSHWASDKICCLSRLLLGKSSYWACIPHVREHSCWKIMRCGQVSAAFPHFIHVCGNIKQQGRKRDIPDLRQSLQQGG